MLTQSAQASHAWRWKPAQASVKFSIALTALLALIHFSSILTKAGSDDGVHRSPPLLQAVYQLAFRVGIRAAT